MSQPTNTRSSVEQRYADAAKQSEAALCCPVEYDRKYLEVIPDEVVEKDYGCGDPSKWVQPGETVLGEPKGEPKGSGSRRGREPKRSEYQDKR